MKLSHSLFPNKLLLLISFSACFYSLTVAALSSQDKLQKLQGTWVQEAIMPSINSMLRTSLPVFGVALEKIIDIPEYSSQLSIEKNQVTVTSLKTVLDKTGKLLQEPVFSAYGILEGASQNPTEIQDHWLFKTLENPFLYCFTETVLPQFLKSFSWEIAYTNLDRVNFELDGNDELTVTVYPHPYSNIKEVKVYYRRYL
ncbi:hypothetical protein CI610_02305 [invertebrate metagenome]|uniref:Uncharacterized protein n=1 Tax=invertebrate metagenome TaxID=1711999 RepID=A0A2H9T6C0_9ZZZZ